MAPPRATPQTDRRETTFNRRKRRGATCDARMTDEMPQTSATKRQTNRRPARIHRHATRPTTCAVPAPGVMNGAPTGYATNQPPQNNNQPTPRPHPPTRNATDHMCRFGTGRHEWRPHGLRHKPTATKPQTNRRPARIRRRATRPTTCAVPAPGVINGAPTGYATNQPPQNNIQPPANVGAPLVTPG